MNDSRNAFRTWGTLAGIFMAASIAFYARVLPTPFIYADHYRIEQNPAVKSLSAPARFLDPGSRSVSPAELAVYQPAAVASLAVDWGLWRDTPFFYRLENVLLHGANAAGVAFVASTVLGLAWPAAVFAGFLFLVHPLAVEPVAWISGRPDILSFLFFLAAVLAWIRFRQGRGFIWAAATHAAFVTAAMASSYVLCFPVMVAFLDGILLRGFDERTPFPLRLPHYTIVTALAGAYVLIRNMKYAGLPRELFPSPHFFATAADALAGLGADITRLAWPAGFSLEPVPAFLGKGPPAAIPVVLLGAVILVARRRGHSLARAWAWFGIGLLIWASGVLFSGQDALFSDGRLYPLTAVAALAGAALLNWASERFERRRVAIAAVVLLSVLSARTLRKQGSWTSDERLWSRVVSVFPSNWLAWAYLGDARVQRAGAVDTAARAELLREAERSYIEALKNRPPAQMGGQMFVSLAEVNLLQGKTNEADEHARRGLVLRPDLEPRWKASRESFVVLSPRS